MIDNKLILDHCNHKVIKHFNLRMIINNFYNFLFTILFDSITFIIILVISMTY